MAWSLYSPANCYMSSTPRRTRSELQYIYIYIECIYSYSCVCVCVWTRLADDVAIAGSHAERADVYSRLTERRMHGNQRARSTN